MNSNEYVIGCDKFTHKILKYKKEDIYIIFYYKQCPYSQNALNYIKTNNLSLKGYDIEKVTGKLNKVLNCLNKTSNVTEFITTHKTVPIIFHKGKFVGGLDKLLSYVKL